MGSYMGFLGQLKKFEYVRYNLLALFHERGNSVLVG